MGIRDCDRNNFSLDITNSSLEKIIKILKKIEKMQKQEKIEIDEITVNLKMREALEELHLFYM